MSDSMDLGGNGGNSFPFEKAGDTVTGKIVSINEVQQTDVKSGQPAVWQDGKPKMMFVVELATAPGTANRDDDGLNTVYIRGAKKPESMSSLAAVVGAVKLATGGSAISKGADLSLSYVGDGPKTNPAYNAPKKYTATYAAPAPKSVDLAAVTGTASVPDAADVIASHPQGAALRAQGVPDAAIKAALGI